MAGVAGLGVCVVLGGWAARMALVWAMTAIVFCVFEEHAVTAANACNNRFLKDTSRHEVGEKGKV